MQQYYYHLCPTFLEIGSIIKKGNFGRILSLYNANWSSPHILQREQNLENIRSQCFQNKPSRLECAFVCSSLDNIKNYQNYINNVSQVIYKVKPVDDDYTYHIGDYHNLIPYNTEITMEQVAFNYWNGIITSPSNIEILIDSNILIVECLK